MTATKKMKNISRKLTDKNGYKTSISPNLFTSFSQKEVILNRSSFALLHNLRFLFLTSKSGFCAFYFILQIKNFWALKIYK